MFLEQFLHVIKHKKGNKVLWLMLCLEDKKTSVGFYYWKKI